MNESSTSKTSASKSVAVRIAEGALRGQPGALRDGIPNVTVMPARRAAISAAYISLSPQRSLLREAQANKFRNF